MTILSAAKIDIIQYHELWNNFCFNILKKEKCRNVSTYVRRTYQPVIASPLIQKHGIIFYIFRLNFLYVTATNFCAIDIIGF